MGVIICGLNGSGKSTLGRALAENLGWRFVDNEDLYFPKTEPDYLYANPRTEAEFLRLLEAAVSAEGPFVYAAVKADHDACITRHFEAAIVVETPRDLRLQRIRSRSYAKFGERMRPGGDLYEREERFFNHVGARPEDHTEQWVRTLRCPVLHVDGTLPVTENMARIHAFLEETSRGQP